MANHANTQQLNHEQELRGEALRLSGLCGALAELSSELLCGAEMDPTKLEFIISLIDQVDINSTKVADMTDTVGLCDMKIAA